MIDICERYTDLIYPNIKPDTYMISNCGRVWNKNTGRELHSAKNSNNDYLVLGLISDNNSSSKYKHVLLHRLVATHFCDGKSELNNTVDHIDGDKTNNHSYNLEWVSQRVNNIRAKENKLNFGYGPTHYKSKFTEEQVKTICSLLEDKLSYSDILKYIGMDDTENNRESIGNIKRRITYNSISKNYCGF